MVIDEIVNELYRVLKPGGVVVWVIGSETDDGEESLTPFEHIYRFINSGFKLYDTMLYTKKNPTPQNKRRYEQCFEYMFVFSKGIPATINLFLQPCTYFGKERKSTYRHNSSDTLSKQHKGGRVKKDKIKNNVWEYSVGNAEKYRAIIKRVHPAKFPILLARDQILSWSKEGDIILDPFIGSRTTAIAAVLTNRKYIGFEISKEYYDMCYEYLKQLDEKIFYKDKKVLEFIQEVNSIKYKQFG